MDKICKDCGFEFFSYGSECPLCLSFNTESNNKNKDGEVSEDTKEN